MNTLKSIPAGEFKQRCLALMNEVAALGIELVITKHGVPVCKLVPLLKNTDQPRFGWLKNSVIIHGDITGPIEEEWDADK